MNTNPNFNSKPNPTASPKPNYIHNFNLKLKTILIHSANGTVDIYPSKSSFK